MINIDSKKNKSVSGLLGIGAKMPLINDIGEFKIILQID